MSKRRNARTNSIVKEKKRKKKRSDDVHRGGKLVGGHHVHGMRRRISLSSNIHDACTSDVHTQSSPSWRTQTRTNTDTLTRSSKFLCLFFVVYRAVSGIDASVSSPRRERRSSLSPGMSFVFETYEPPTRIRSRRTHVHVCMCTSESVRACATRTRVSSCDSQCVCVVRTDVHSRAVRLVGKREESKVEGSAPRYSSTFGSACQKALFTVSRENELFNSSRCRW